MWSPFPLALLLLVGCGAPDGADDSPDGAPVEASPFIGSWAVFELEGERAPRQDIWTFTDSMIEIDSAGGTFSGTFTFDAVKTPHEVDIFLGSVTPGLAIYKLDGDDTLLLMMDDGAGTRATNFEIAADNYDHIRFTRF